MANSGEAQKKVKAVLKQIFGERHNKEYQLTGVLVLIGRSPKCQIHLSTPSISRKHCMLTQCKDGWRIKDSKSQNGTYVNGRKLQPDENFLLQYGDIVFLGPPSEMPQAFSYEEVTESDNDVVIDDDDDDDIIELPVPIKRTYEGNVEITPKKTAKKFIQSSEYENFGEHPGCRSSSSGSKCHSKGLNKVINKQNKKATETKHIPEEICNLFFLQENNDLNSESLVSTTSRIDYGDQINEISSTGSDHRENSESLLIGGSSITSLFPPSDSEGHLELDATETCRERKSEKSEKDKELELKLVLLSKQIEALQENRRELIKNYENVCEKNKALDQQLADKEKKLEEDLQRHEVKAKNEVKSELLEKLEEDLVCNICTELFIKPTVLDCSHTFCEFCIKEWRKKKNDCPICRCKIKSATRVRTLEEFIDKILATLTPEERVKRDNVIAQRLITEQPPKPGTPKRRRSARSRRHRHYRHAVNPVNVSSIQIIEDIGTHILEDSGIPSTSSQNMPVDELNIQASVDIFNVPMFSFFFS